VIPFLQQLGLSVSSHNHLVEVERNAESPAEVCDEHEVKNDSNKNTCSRIRCNVASSSHDEGEETNVDTYTKVANKLDGISANFFEDQESNQSKSSSDNGDNEEYKDHHIENAVHG